MTPQRFVNPRAFLINSGVAFFASLAGVLSAAIHESGMLTFIALAFLLTGVGFIGYSAGRKEGDAESRVADAGLSWVAGGLIAFIAGVSFVLVGPFGDELSWIRILVLLPLGLIPIATSIAIALAVGAKGPTGFETSRVLGQTRRSPREHP